MSMTSPKVERQANWMHEPLAIIGMACRLPGADDLQQFWQLLQSGNHGIARFPDQFVDRELYLTDQKGVRGKSYSDVGGLISSRPIDWSLMPISPDAGQQFDPSHLILCEVAARACQHGGYDQARLKGSRTGVYVGHSGGSTLGGEIAYRTLLSDYIDLLADLPQWQALPAASQKQIQEQLQARLRAQRPARRAGGGPTVDASCAAGLIHQAFDLSGPHMSIDAACASSLVALALAATALHAGQIDTAIVGGASYNKFDSLILFSHAQSCSASGTSRPFDAAADGLISSEGYVVFVVKRLDQAQANGDSIVAVIRGIGLSSDGRGRSLWAPRKEGQASAIERAYSPAITADSVQLVEAHATSTQVGDATEMEALAGFFQANLSSPKRIPVGSVKSNIGHTLETAGLAGLLKAILSIQHQTIPPSINVTQLNEAIDWPNIPLYVPHQCEPWPALPAGQPRRAAVNAFGIGGLNVHVIVDEYLAPADNHLPTVRPSHQPQARLEPIAVIGRGLVLPGALDVPAFARLLLSGHTQACPPPEARWRKLTDRRLPADELNVVGGYITDYHYDWRKHKVPPKQIAQANPLQFMLLEAAEQALREAGYLDRAWNKQRTAVVVGSVFGGDFGNSLYAGLRLPEFKRELTRLLAQATSASIAAEIVQHYEELFLKRYPALLDETGSFTSSTLASRLSKTFDLMGGAMAIDAADASAMAALDAATGLLRSGTVDHVLCSTGQSALDRASFERIGLSQGMIDRQQFEAASASQRRQLQAAIPAEGVALVLLKRLSDAQADGDRILATIHDITAGSGHSSSTAIPSANPSASPGQSMARQTVGNLQGSQGLVDVIEQSLVDSAKSNPVTLTQETASGLHYVAVVQAGEPEAATELPVAPQPTIHETQCAVSDDGWSVIRLASPDKDDLAQKLHHLTTCGWSDMQRLSLTNFSAATQWRAALVVSPSDYRQKAALLSAQLGQANSIVPLAEQGLYWSQPEQRTGRTAWLFPGQGSQYPAMLRELVASNSVAQAALAECNQVLKELGEPTFEQIAWGETSQLGENVWHTQAAMLVADYVSLSILRAHGFTADVVAGHSYGELAAMLAANCWDIRNALIATWHRCRSISAHAPAACGMLSIQASATTVEQLIRDSHSQVSISHRNAPEQTVVGGRQAAVAQFAQVIDNEGLASRLLAVPAAFHTRTLTEAQQPFAVQLERIAIQPPRIALLSSVSATYVADPQQLRQGLVAQLITPLDYIALVERLIADGVRLAIEVGPQQVLTRLTRQIAGSRLIVLSTDHVKRGHRYQLLSAQAGLEVYGTTTTSSQPLFTQHQSLVDSITPKPPIIEPLHFDATAQRRERMRAAALRSPAIAATSMPASAAPVLQFDASQVRRQRNASHSSPREKVAALPNPVQPTPAAPANTLPPVQVANQTAAMHPASAESHTPPSLPSISISAPVPNTPASQAAIETFLIDFVVEQTGYPAEIIELDWDIEADLGIDSIKKAQLFGELREFFDLESLTTFSLDNFKSLRDIVNLLVTVPGKGDWLLQSATSAPAEPITQPAPSIQPAPSTQPSPISAPAPEATAPSSAAPVTVAPQPIVQASAPEPMASSASQSSKAQLSSSQLEQFLVDFVVEQTGYPPEIVELDADLEADLGIDSIKKAQLFGELREMFTFPAVDANESGRLSLSEFRTLRNVKDWLVSAQPSVTTPAAVPEPLTASTPSQPGQSVPSHASLANASLAGTSLPTAPLLHETAAKATASPLPAASEGDYEFRQLVPLGISELPFANSSGLPVVRLSQPSERGWGQVTVTSGYVPAVFANLQAMTGRPGRAEDDQQVHYNGQRQQVQAEAARLAGAIGAADVSLMALDACLLAQASWEPASVSEPVIEPGALRMVAQYKVPAWLIGGGGVPLALHLRQQAEATQLQWSTPGCVHGLMHFNAGGLLVAGGSLNAAAHAAGHPSTNLELANWLAQQARVNTTLTTFERATRQLRLAGDWWVMGVDVRSAQRVLVECRDGVIVIMHGSLPAAEPHGDGSAALVMLDTEHKQLVIRTQLRPRPFEWDEARIALSQFAKAPAQPVDRSVQPADPLPAWTPKSADSTATPVENGPASITQRFILRMAPAPQRPVTGRRPTWSGTALIVGDNPVAIQLESRLRSAQVPVIRWAGTDDPTELARRFDEAIKQQSIRHLFLTTPCDPQAKSTLDATAWNKRRNVGLMSLYWLCQRWHQHVCASGWVDDASLVAVTSLGGDFGLQGKVPSIEGGALSGLLKSILIESWVQGFRTFPIKVIDTCCQDSPAQIANNIWHELSIPSFDVEVAYCQGERHVVRAIARPLDESATTGTRWPITHGGTWVCTGGARGITAYVAEKIALRYQLKLHLIGTQPLPTIADSWRHLDDAGLRELKAQVMTSARAAGKNPVTTWQDTEKALEIDRNLRRFAQLGIEVHYHSCDVTDRAAVAATLTKVREISGPIHGVLHGAGIGKDARFDRKQPEKVNQCIGAKVDGAWSLIEATWHDPLEAFVGFGSISGRFGANGHTDYSLANDMLCKQMDWLRVARPTVHAIGFHWHAWGDIGMATKPETKLALEMIDMQFMPAVEGVEHLLKELAGGSEDSEVLITDDRYYRLFYEPDLLVDAAGRSLAHMPPPTPLIETQPQMSAANERLHVAQLNPAKDPFLTEHRLDDRPLLPIVIGTELMLEAARAHLGHMQPLKLRNVRALQGLRFYTDTVQTLRVVTSSSGSEPVIECRLMSDFHARDGRLVDRDRVNMTGEVVLAGQPAALTRLSLPESIDWQRPIYPAAGSKFYVGLPLQRLRGFALLEDGLVGRITAPALIELAGGRREVRGWQLPSSAVDACLFATGLLAWQRVAPGSALPAGFGEIELGRAPWAGEACRVHVRLREATTGTAVFDFTLYGVNQDVLVNVRDYKIAWLTDASRDQLAPSTSVAR